MSLDEEINIFHSLGASLHINDPTCKFVFEAVTLAAASRHQVRFAFLPSPG